MPSQVAIADLLPALLPHLGENLPDAGLDHGGWVLQRLGEPPLDEEGTPASLGLADGAVLHLRPRSDQIPPVDFDDLADGLATGLGDRPGVWRAEMTRWAAAGTLSFLLAAGLPVLAAAGPVLLRAITAGVLAVVAMAGSLALVRAFGDVLYGMVVAIGGVAYAGLAAAIAPGAADGPQPLQAGVAQLFTAATVVAIAALAAAMVTGRGGPVFAGVAAAGVLGAVAAGAALLWGLSAAQGAGVAAVLATVLGIAVPALSAKLARIRVDPLPTKPEHLQEDIDPEPSDEVLALAMTADRYMTGLHAGLAVVLLTALAMLAVAGGWAPLTLILLVVVARLLNARSPTSGWHRLALGLPALTGLIGAGWRSLAIAGGDLRALIVLGLLPIAAVLLFVVGRALPRRRIMPIWGRVGDLLQLTVTVAMLPILAAVLGLYGAARAIGG